MHCTQPNAPSLMAPRLISVPRPDGNLEKITYSDDCAHRQRIMPRTAHILQTRDTIATAKSAPGNSDRPQARGLGLSNRALQGESNCSGKITACARIRPRKRPYNTEIVPVDSWQMATVHTPYHPSPAQRGPAQPTPSHPASPHPTDTIRPRRMGIA